MERENPSQNVHQMVRSQSFTGEIIDMPADEEPNERRRRSRSRPRVDEPTESVLEQPVTMAERMKGRRCSNINSDEVIASIVNTNNNQVEVIPQYSPEVSRSRQRRQIQYDAPPQDLRHHPRSDSYYHSVPHNQQQHISSRPHNTDQHVIHNQQQLARRRRNHSHDVNVEQQYHQQTPSVFSPTSPQYLSRDPYNPPAPIQPPQHNPRRRGSVDNMYEDSRSRSTVRRQRSHDVLLDTRSSSPSSQASSHSSVHFVQDSMRSASQAPQYVPQRQRSSNVINPRMNDDAANYRDKLRQYSIQQANQHHRKRPTPNNTLC